MLHMTGDYYSTMPPLVAWMIIGILIFILFIMTIVQLRKAEVKRLRELNAPPTQVRQTYLAAQKMSMGDLDSIAKETNAISRTHP